jgi:hypothetical protein
MIWQYLLVWFVIFGVITAAIADRKGYDRNNVVHLWGPCCDRRYPGSVAKTRRSEARPNAYLSFMCRGR